MTNLFKNKTNWENSFKNVRENLIKQIFEDILLSVKNSECHIFLLTGKESTGKQHLIAEIEKSFRYILNNTSDLNSISLKKTLENLESQPIINTKKFKSNILKKDKDFFQNGPNISKFSCLIESLPPLSPCMFYTSSSNLPFKMPSVIGGFLNHVNTYWGDPANATSLMKKLSQRESKPFFEHASKRSSIFSSIKEENSSFFDQLESVFNTLYSKSEIRLEDLPKIEENTKVTPSGSCISENLQNLSQSYNINQNINSNKDVAVSSKLTSSSIHNIILKYLEGLSSHHPLFIWMDNIQQEDDTLTFLSQITTRCKFFRSPSIIVASINRSSFLDKKDLNPKDNYNILEKDILSRFTTHPYVHIIDSDELWCKSLSDLKPEKTVIDIETNSELFNIDNVIEDIKSAVGINGLKALCLATFWGETFPYKIWSRFCLLNSIDNIFEIATISKENEWLIPCDFATDDHKEEILTFSHTSIFKKLLSIQENSENNIDEHHIFANLLTSQKNYFNVMEIIQIAISYLASNQKDRARSALFLGLLFEYQMGYNHRVGAIFNLWATLWNNTYFDVKNNNSTNNVFSYIKGSLISAEAFHLLRHHKTAIAMIDDIIQKTNLTTNDYWYNRLILTRSRYSVDLGMVTISEEMLSSICKYFEVNSNHNELAESAFHQGRNLFNQGRIDESQQCLLQALSLYEKQGDMSGQARSLRCLSEIAARKRDGFKASHYLDQAMYLLQKTGDRRRLGLSMGLAGRIAGLLNNNLYHATSCYQQAIDIFEQEGLFYEWIWALGDLAEIERSNFQPKKAEEHYKKAIHHLESVGSHLVYSYYVNLALVYLAQEQFSNAKEIILTAKPYIEKSGLKPFLLMIHASLLYCEAMFENWHAWENSLEELSILLEEGLILEQQDSWPLITLLDKLINRKDYNRALRLCEKLLILWSFFSDKETYEKLLEDKKFLQSKF